MLTLLRCYIELVEECGRCYATFFQGCCSCIVCCRWCMLPCLPLSTSEVVYPWFFTGNLLWDLYHAMFNQDLHIVMVPLGGQEGNREHKMAKVLEGLFILVLALGY